jgi:uncharacterized protein YlzI (FlbEa/FlbD family)
MYVGLIEAANGVGQFIRPGFLAREIVRALQGAHMWIALTDFDGKQIFFNTTHLVSMKEHGPGTIITHVVGQTVVSESPETIRKVLGLTQTTAMTNPLHRYGVEGRA